ncbi:hypothetical protein FOZ63_020898 [Perkinsus olseni]|uniref:Uncharacterized protein n=1 Tax=Perkinsus olseni TaxID=32597 RepID=A0A7J6SFM9_PEROL|nr:hypothetical protein FOZ63_020898 [Perkinsus olseni]
MFIFSQPLDQIAPERLDVDGAADAYASEDVSNSQSFLKSLPSSGACVDRSTRLITSLIMTCSGLYIFFNLGLMVSKNFIIEGYISRWRMEMRGFDMGPPPVWLNNPPHDFFHLPPGSDKYATFSLSVMVQNNPRWLKVEISTLDNTAVSEDGEISITEKVPLVRVNELAYTCLRDVQRTMQPLAITIVFESEFSLFGHRSNAFELAAALTYDALGYTNMARDIPWGGELALRCKETYKQPGVYPAGLEYGEIVVHRANFKLHRAVFRFPQLDDTNMTFLGISYY